MPHSHSNALLRGEVQSLLAREPTALGKPGFAHEPLALLFLKGVGALFELFHPGARLLRAGARLLRGAIKIAAVGHCQTKLIWWSGPVSFRRCELPFAWLIPSKSDD